MQQQGDGTLRGRPLRGRTERLTDKPIPSCFLPCIPVAWMRCLLATLSTTGSARRRHRCCSKRWGGGVRSVELVLRCFMMYAQQGILLERRQACLSPAGEDRMGPEKV